MRNQKQRLLSGYGRFPCTPTAHSPHDLRGQFKRCLCTSKSPLKAGFVRSNFDGLHEKFLRTLWSARGWKAGTGTDRRGGDKVGEGHATTSVASGTSWAGKCCDFRHVIFTGKCSGAGRDARRFAPWEPPRGPKRKCCSRFGIRELGSSKLMGCLSLFTYRTASSFKKNVGRYMPSAEPGNPDKASFMLYVLNSVCQYKKEETIIRQ